MGTHDAGRGPEIERRARRLVRAELADRRGPHTGGDGGDGGIVEVADEAVEPAGFGEDVGIDESDEGVRTRGRAVFRAAAAPPAPGRRTKTAPAASAVLFRDAELADRDPSSITITSPTKPPPNFASSLAAGPSSSRTGTTTVSSLGAGSRFAGSG